MVFRVKLWTHTRTHLHTLARVRAKYIGGRRAEHPALAARRHEFSSTVVLLWTRKPLILVRRRSRFSRRNGQLAWQKPNLFELVVDCNRMRIKLYILSLSSLVYANNTLTAFIQRDRELVSSRSGTRRTDTSYRIRMNARRNDVRLLQLRPNEWMNEWILHKNSLSPLAGWICVSATSTSRRRLSNWHVFECGRMMVVVVIRWGKSESIVLCLDC